MKAYLLNHWQVVTTALAVVGVLLTLGCASIQARPDPVRLGVTLGVAKLLENSSEPERRAQNIREVTTKVLTFLEGNPETTVELLRGEALRHIPSDLPAVDRAIALEIVNTVTAVLRERVAAGVIPRDKVVAVRAVLQWVLDGVDFPRAGAPPQ